MSDRGAARRRLAGMTFHEQFCRLRKGVAIWFWPILAYELWLVRLWSEEEALARGEEFFFLIVADTRGRVRVRAVSDRPAAPHALDGLSRFLLPESLRLDDAPPAPCPVFGLAMAAPLHPARDAMAWRAVPVCDTS